MARISHRRGLQIMRTQSTRKAGGTLTSPEMYIRLTSLEMERARRVMERDRLLERVQLLDERIAKINTEQSEMRLRIDLVDTQNRAPESRSAPASSTTSGKDANPYGLTY